MPRKVPEGYALPQSLKSVFRYLSRHWRGEEAFGWAFWVNLVALRAILSLGQSLVGLFNGWFVDAPLISATIVAVFLHGPVFVWQIVGVLRSAEKHVQFGGPMAHVWGAQLGCLIAFWIVLSDTWAAWHLISPPQDAEVAGVGQVNSRGKPYRLIQDADSGLIVIEGEIALGITKHLARVLESDSNLTTVRLTSEGGNIYEGRGLRRVIAEHGLATEVAGHCNSACTLAFIGGTTRRMLQDGRLGFHQYRLDADYDVPFSDPDAEQVRDQALFRRAGATQTFTEKMFKSPPTRIWYPSHEELRSAGVID